MAWSQDIRDKVRNGYIFDQLPLDIVAMKYAVPHDTARRWKTQAMKNGDDWDKLRAAHALAGDGLETDRLATALEVVQRLGAFIKERHPAQYAPFLEVLEGFAKELEDNFS